MATEVSDNATRSRYEISDDGVTAGFAEYHLHGDVIAFIHTQIDDEFGGRGFGSTLIEGALDDARRRGLTVQPFCSFVRKFIAEHDPYLDLVRDAERERFGLS
jgi:predicted GNAT family acetyltransferase